MTFDEFISRFITEEQCRDYLYQLRWPDGYRCSQCQCDRAWETKEHRFRCKNKDCRHLTTVIGGTLFSNTHVPLTSWFRAIWYATSQTQGTTALGLENELGVNNHTALSMLYNIRRAMCFPEPLEGVVAVDILFYAEYYLLIAVEMIGEDIGQIRIEVSATEQNCLNIPVFIRRNIKSGATIMHYGGADFSYFYTDEPYSQKMLHPQTYCFNNCTPRLLPPVYLAISELKKRGLLGKLQCFSSKDQIISLNHIDRYLNECCFKFNKWDSRETWFYEILERAVKIKPRPYNPSQKNEVSFEPIQKEASHEFLYYKESPESE